MLTRAVIHCRRAAAVLLALGELSPAWGAAPLPDLEHGFREPPEQSKPWCYWYWISDNMSREGITRDLEAMARIGIGEAFIGNIHLDEVPAGDTKVLTEQWWDLVEHAIREAGRVGVNIGMFNCPGWSQSGGSWVQPRHAMRYLVSSEVRATGPARLEAVLAPPADQFQDVALLAFPAPRGDADALAARRPRVTCTPAVENARFLADGRLDTVVTFPAGAGAGSSAFTIDVETDVPLAARSLAMVPAETPWAADCELLAADEDGAFRTMRTFRFDRSNMGIHVGPMPHGPVTVSFPPVTSSRFRISLTDLTGTGALAELDLSGAARLEAFVEKQLGKMHPTPLPMWDTYLWPTQPEPDAAELTVPPDAVLDLTSRLAPDGRLEWNVPPGEWVLLRVGMVPTGTRNAPAAPEGQGLEIDKMNRAAAAAHFDAFIGTLLRRMPAPDRTAFRHVVADSYEMGSQNWTDGFASTFRERYGYDPLPWLPVLTGRIVASADESERFLWDLRRLVADHIATDYVGGLRDLCRPHGLELWLENYGHWGFPAEFLQYGGQSDRIGGEFWVTGDLGSIECRAASSAANIYGKPIVSGEAFTGGPPFQTVPSGLKARGDWAFCEGINHLVLHVTIHQPWPERRPGLNAWFGTEFNRHNTWFDRSRAWVDYLRRCSFLLQQGTRVADVAYFIGEDAPKMTGVRRPELPPGRDFDYINAEVIEERLAVKDGRLALPHGTTYRVLVLPEQATMRPALLRRLRDLVAAGATVLGPPPSRSPSREGYPECDAEVRALAAELWGDGAAAPAGEHRFGAGRVIWGQTLDAVLVAAGVLPDFASDAPLRYTHRAAGANDIYFLANPQPHDVSTIASFRTSGRAPEFWWPETGRIARPAVYDGAGGRTSAPIRLGPHGSVFVLFRDAPAAHDRIVSVTLDGRPLLETIPNAAHEADAEAPAGAGALDLARAPDGSVEACVWRPGSYVLKTADGRAHVQDVAALPEPMLIGGPWDVSFTPGCGAPESVTFDRLEDWTRRPEEGVRHYSGTATYRKTFELPDDIEGEVIHLDLGRVCDLATVRLNGQELGTLWLAPWRIDIGNAARPGSNLLEIEIVNAWNNRLVGDARLPETERRTYLAVNTLPADAALLPAGLLGPVTIRAAATFTLP